MGRKHLVRPVEAMRANYCATGRCSEESIAALAKIIIRLCRDAGHSDQRIGAAIMSHIADSPWPPTVADIMHRIETHGDGHVSTEVWRARLDHARRKSIGDVIHWPPGWGPPPGDPGCMVPPDIIATHGRWAIKMHERAVAATGAGGDKRDKR